MLVYIVTVAVSAFFVPHYLSIFWEPLRTNPWDIVGGAIVIVVLVALNVVGVQEAAKLSITLAVVDFATQLLLVIVGFALVFSPEMLTSNVHWGVAPTWGNLAVAIPVAMLAYTGVETVSNLAEEARDPVRTVPNAYKARRRRGLRHLLHASVRRALGASGRADRRRADHAARAPARGRWLRERPDPRSRAEPRRRRGLAAGRDGDLRRRPRGDDPLHRDERGRDRRIADHVLDGELPADAGGVPAAPSAAEDAVALARRLRRDRADPGHPPRRRQLRRDALLARRDALVHRRPRLDHPHADAAARRRRDPVPGAAEPARRPASTGRSSRIVGGVATGISFLVLVVQNPATRWVGLGWLAFGLAGYAIYRRSVSSVPACARP